MALPSFIMTTSNALVSPGAAVISISIGVKLKDTCAAMWLGTAARITTTLISTIAVLVIRVRPPDTLAATLAPFRSNSGRKYIAASLSFLLTRGVTTKVTPGFRTYPDEQGMLVSLSADRKRGLIQPSQLRAMSL